MLRTKYSLNIPKAAIVEAAKGSIILKKESGAFWQANVEIDFDFELCEQDKLKADKLWDWLALGRRYKEAQKRQAFYVLIANLLYYKGKAISISLNNNDYIQRNTKYTSVSDFIIELVHIFHKHKLIEMKPGKEIISRMTRITATDLLLEDCPVFPNGIILRKDMQLVILKDENGKLKEYNDTAWTRKVRKELTAANEVNTSANIFFGKEKITVFNRAIYNEKFTMGGRLYTKGYRHVQGLSGEERRELTINNDPIIELDYKALHPMLLYAEEEIQYQGDCYSVVDDRLEVRPLLKMIMLCIINCKDWTEAESGANNWLNVDSKKAEREMLYALGITKVRPFMQKLIREHKPIQNYFFRGAGLKLQNQDGKIALQVIKHFIRKGIPILSVHDSFIIQEQYCQELDRVMKEVYYKHTGGFTIEIKGQKTGELFYV